MDDEGALNFNPDEMRENFNSLKNKLRSYKKTRLSIKIFMNGWLLYALISSQWFTAFLLWVMFFPDIEELIKLFKGVYSFKNKEGHQSKT